MGCRYEYPLREVWPGMERGMLKALQKFASQDVVVSAQYFVDRVVRVYVYVCVCVLTLCVWTVGVERH